MKSLTKELQFEFYNREIESIIEEYKTYLESKCSYLFNMVELYVGVFEYVDELRNQVVFSFPLNKLPTIKIPLTATKPKSNDVITSNFNDYTYLHYRNNCVEISSECYGIYYYEDNGKLNVGFSNFDLEFINKLIPGDNIVFGRSDPPLQYYFNLIKITKNERNFHCVNEVTLGKYHLNDFKPVYVSDSLELIHVYKTDIKSNNTIIIQGPPGTGKTYFISRLLDSLVKEKKSILVASLANRTLIELAKKYVEIEAVDSSAIYKTYLTLEEFKEVNELKPMPKDFMPADGNILLTTFYKMTGFALSNIHTPIYDYIVIEEASQCFLGTIAGAKILGKNVILVGDPLQLSPVVNQQNPESISPDIDLMLESFTFFASTVKCPKFRFTTAYRFSDNACYQTNTFYENSLRSESEIQSNHEIFLKIPLVFNNKGGCSIHYYDSSNLNSVYDFLYAHINSLFQINSSFHVAILSSTKNGVKLLRENLLFKLKDRQDNIIINTVDSVQGLTVDFCFYFAHSDANPSFSFKLNRFNVATSRSRYCTLVLLDEVYRKIPPFKGLVAEFISKC